MTQSNPYSERRLFGDPLDLDPETTAVLVIDMLSDFCTKRESLVIRVP